MNLCNALRYSLLTDTPRKIHVLNILRNIITINFSLNLSKKFTECWLQIDLQMKLDFDVDSMFI